jgi:hypothetical protein
MKATGLCQGEAVRQLPCMLLWCNAGTETILPFTLTFWDALCNELLVGRILLLLLLRITLAGACLHVAFFFVSSYS